MKHAFVTAASVSTALCFIWLVSVEAFVRHVSTAAAIIIDVSSAPTQAVPVYFPSALISFHGFKSRKFTLAGSCLSFVSGVLLLSSGLQYFCAVFAFYVVNSAMIVYIWRHKHYMGGYVGGSNHPYPPLGIFRVAVKGFLPALLCTCKSVLARNHLMGPNCINCRIADVAFLSYVACCTGYGFSNELSSLRFAKPRLITTWRSVMPGVSGGVTLMGTAASAFGGGIIGLVFCVSFMLSPVRELPTEAFAGYKWHIYLGMGVLAGLLGTCFGSLLGATLQYSGFDTVTNKVVSHANGSSIEHVTGIDLLDTSQIILVASTLTCAAFAAVAWLKLSYVLN